MADGPVRIENRNKVRTILDEGTKIGFTPFKILVGLSNASKRIFAQSLIEPPSERNEHNEIDRLEEVKPTILGCGQRLGKRIARLRKYVENNGFNNNQSGTEESKPWADEDGSEKRNGEIPEQRGSIVATIVIGHQSKTDDEFTDEEFTWQEWGMRPAQQRQVEEHQSTATDEYPRRWAHKAFKSVNFVEKELREQKDDQETSDQEAAPANAVLILVLRRTSGYPVKGVGNTSAYRINEPEDRRCSDVSFLLCHDCDGISTTPSRQDIGTFSRSFKENFSIERGESLTPPVVFLIPCNPPFLHEFPQMQQH